MSSPPCDEAFRSAVAVWHMADAKDASGRNELKIVGRVTLGVRLDGKELEDSLATGNDGLAARLEGGYLDAGQGDGGMLNPTGSALTVGVRLRSPSGAWGKPLLSKHGGHDRLVYNLFSFDWAIGFELGTRDVPGMTQVLAPLAAIGPRDWHDVICRYDGTTLQMFVDGVLISEASTNGPLRTGNSEPCLIGAELDIGWNARGQELEVNGEKTRLGPQDGRVRLHVLLDIPSVEVVAGGGASYTIKARDHRKLGERSPMEIQVEGGRATFSRLEFHPLESIHR